MLYNRFLVEWRMRLRLYDMRIANTLMAIFIFSISLCILGTMPGPLVFNHIFSHSAIAMLIATVIFYVIFILNFYIPTNHPNYEETAMVINKSYTYNIRSYGHHHITFQFENEEINDKVIRIDKALFNQIKLGDTCTITLQNGFFNIPIIKDKSFD